MFQGRKVVSVTPYGRRRYVEILAHYLLDLRGVIDEHHFWVNTDDREDLAFVEALAAEYPDFFHLVYDSSRYSRKAPYRGSAGSGRSATKTTRSI